MNIRIAADRYFFQNAKLLKYFRYFGGFSLKFKTFSNYMCVKM